LEPLALGNLNIFLALVVAQFGSRLFLPIQQHVVDTVKDHAKTFKNAIRAQWSQM